MGELHWETQNTCSHYGAEGLFALGFDPDFAPPRLDFGFTETDKDRSISRIVAQLPRIIREFAPEQEGVVSFRKFFGAVCNETPATKLIISEAALQLRAQKELEIVGPDGKPKPRASRIGWDDAIKRPAAPTLFGPWTKK